MVVVKNGQVLFGLGVLKSAVYQRIDEMSWFFLHAETNLGKLKVTLVIIGWP